MNIKTTKIRIKNSTQNTDSFHSTKKERKLGKNVLKEESINNNHSTHLKRIASSALLDEPER